MKKTKVCQRLSCTRKFETYVDKQCCSQRCAQLIKSDEKLELWLNGNWEIAKNKDGSLREWARRYMLEKVMYACSVCRWSECGPHGNIPLEIDHIDGDWQNSRPANLRVLCPNCHSLTENWKAYNVGNNSQSRYAYFKERGWH